MDESEEILLQLICNKHPLKNKNLESLTSRISILLFTFALMAFRSKCIFMKCSELIRILMRNGWIVISQRGSHLKMAHPNKTNILIVPNHGANEIGKGLEKKLMKDAGINTL